MKEPIAIGQVFTHEQKKYLLAQTAKMKVSLINLEEGNRFHEAIQVQDNENISESEWFHITFGKPESFILKKGY